MQKPIVTKAIVLSRVDYGEADRILTLLTPDHGKVKAMAKGVRRSRSKMAGGIELFSVSSITYIPGRRDISTLISTRLDSHFGGIVKNIGRTTAAYEVIQIINKATEEAAEPAYYTLLSQTLEALNDSGLHPQLTAFWFKLQLLKLAGHEPNFQTDTEGKRLDADKKYGFYFDEMKFGRQSGGGFGAKPIKFLRISSQAGSPEVLGRVEGAGQFINDLHPLVLTMLRQYIRI